MDVATLQCHPAGRNRTGWPVLCGVLLSATSGSGMHMLFGLHVSLEFCGENCGAGTPQKSKEEIIKMIISELT